MSARVPWRTSLRARLLVTSILIALCSIAATAWLAVSTTTRSIQQQPTQVLADDATIYDTLLGYAATHPRWDGVLPTIRDLARRSGRRITLTSTARRPIAAAGAGAAALPAQASAVVNPLEVNGALAPASEPDGIDPRAVGPFRLPRQQQNGLLDVALKAVSCLRAYGYGATISVSPSGRPDIEITGSDPKSGWFFSCGVPTLEQPTATEHQALTSLNTSVNNCLAQARQPGVFLNLDFTWMGTLPSNPAIGQLSQATAPSTAEDQVVQSCIDASRRAQLKPYVPAPALLFITGPPGSVTAHLGLSSAGRDRIAAATALVLLLTVTVTVIVSTRLVRPLTTLTDAVQHPARPHVRVPVTSGDEIGRLTAAFNDLSERRERMEAQRTAMVSDIAHELRTPLGNIRGWLEAAEDGLATSDRAFISSLLEEAVLLQHVIDDLQHLAAADAGQLRLHREPIQVSDLLDQVVVAHRGRASAAGIALAARTEGDPEAPADPVRLRQAIGNLVANALRHTAAGGAVTIGCHPAGGQIIVEVADTGSGIAPDDLPRIFDRFWRADKSRSRRTGGSGLGLPITRQLVEAHGGTITVASVVGEGTVFTIRLPAE
jgi:two-component system sensor histidine kinase BaeS